VLWTVHCAVDSALCCGQCTVLWTVHCAFVIIRESGHCLPHVVVKMVRGCASTSQQIALCCGQCTVLSTVFLNFLKRVIIRDVGHSLSYFVVIKERRCASTSPIRLHGVNRDSFNTIHIVIVTD
jgi:hypothetical protein